MNQTEKSAKKVPNFQPDFDLFHPIWIVNFFFQKSGFVSH